MPLSLDGAVRLKPHYSVIAHAADVVELRSGVFSPVSFTITDDARAGTLYRVLDGLREGGALAEISARSGAPLDEVRRLAGQLAELDALEDGPSTALGYYLERLVPTLAGRAAARPAPPPALLLGEGALTGLLRGHLSDALPDLRVDELGPDAPAWDALRRVSASLTRDGLAQEQALEAFSGWRGRYVVYIATALDPLALRALNRVCVALDIPWLSAVLDGPSLYVGPTFAPGRSACYECFEARVLMNLREDASYLRYKRALVEGRVRHGRIPVASIISGLLASHAAFEAANFLATAATFTVGKALAIHLPTMEVAFSEVLKVPGCGACGASLDREARDLYLDARALLDDGGSDARGDEPHRGARLPDGPAPAADGQPALRPGAVGGARHPRGG
jgi:bacteriocin biosynthesis cyclodehydratase domain-containing protein